MTLDVKERLDEIDALAGENTRTLSTLRSPLLRAELLDEHAELLDEVVALSEREPATVAARFGLGREGWTPQELTSRAHAFRAVAWAARACAAGGPRERSAVAELELVAGELLEEIADPRTSFERRNQAGNDVLQAAGTLAQVRALAEESYSAEEQLTWRVREPRRRAELIGRLIRVIERLAELDAESPGVVGELRRIEFTPKHNEDTRIALCAVVDAELAAAERRPREASSESWVEETIGAFLDELADPASDTGQRCVAWAQVLAALQKRAEQADRTA